MGDLERAIARLCASSLGSFGRDDCAVVLYEDAAKRKVAAFVAALKGLQKLQVTSCLCGNKDRRNPSSGRELSNGP